MQNTKNYIVDINLKHIMETNFYVDLDLGIEFHAIQSYLWCVSEYLPGAPADVMKTSTAIGKGWPFHFFCVFHCAPMEYRKELLFPFNLRVK